MPHSYHLFILHGSYLQVRIWLFKVLLQICVQAFFTCLVLHSICPPKPENKTIMFAYLIKCVTQVLIYLYLTYYFLLGLAICNMLQNVKISQCSFFPSSGLFSPTHTLYPFINYSSSSKMCRKTLGKKNKSGRFKPVAQIAILALGGGFIIRTLSQRTSLAGCRLLEVIKVLVDVMLLSTCWNNK